MIHEVTKAKIAARCEAYNKAHRILLDAAPAIREWVATMIGKPIYKADGGLLKKFSDTKPIIENVWIECSGYSIRAEARHVSVGKRYINQRGDTDCVNESGGFSLYFCDVKQGVAVANPNYGHDHLRTDYNPEECIAALEKLYEIEKQVSAITDGLHHCISARLTINHP